MNNKERIPATERLAIALEQAGAPAQMIQRARSGYYDDFKSESAMPQLLLISDAKFNKLPDIIRRAQEGEFEAQKWESDEWAKSAEGQETLKELGHLLK